jgi:gliding motility-associated-like protein
MIFNRWGEKILETKDYFNNPWNGTYKGLVQPAGVYVFLIRLNDEQKQMLKGSVTLIR